ncbi:hypothetical protein [Sphingobacterium siyangense]|uniref:Uncharacterized protein n=1 Tax=Sphingobacterium siyangense TaxID=459529 RepID=A0A562MKA2_9SPHI|nr:hypothetical protein [Sphingobacterium siyangense]TWI20357.1 hypothetical protein IQ31_02312 [Sphingobacterium siyangense]
MKIEELSLADLKAAHDFVLQDLKELEEKAQEKGILPEKIGCYSEVKSVENKLYHQLLNLTRALK